MHKIDFPDFRKLLDETATVFGSKKLEDGRVQLYWDALSDLPLETVGQAVRMHRRYGKYFPKPAELRPKADKVPSIADPARKAEFEQSEKRCIEGWDARLKRDPIRPKWELLASYLQNRDAEDQSTLLHAEKMEFARGAFYRLIEEAGGADSIGKNYFAWNIAIRFDPNLALDHPLAKAKTA